MISTLLFSGMLVLPIAALFANNPSRTSKIIFYMGSMEFPEPILLLIVLSAVVQALFSFLYAVPEGSPPVFILGRTQPQPNFRGAICRRNDMADRGRAGRYCRRNCGQPCPTGLHSSPHRIAPRQIPRSLDLACR